MLNDTIDIATAPDDVRRAFLQGSASKQLLPAGYELYKFTHHPLYKPDGTVTPWWSSVEPVAVGDPGLKGSLDRAKGLGVPAADFARARTAVTRQWNKMSGLLRARLLVPAYGLVGRCAHQPYDEAPEFANVAFIGGAWQLWIPNLTRHEIAAVP